MSTRCRAFLLVVVVAVAGGCAGVPQRANTVPSVAPYAGTDEELDRIRVAVEAAARREPPRGYAAVPSGVRLLSVSRRNTSIVLDFSPELLANGTGPALEEALHQLLNAASGARSSPRERVEDYTVLVNGAPLESLR